MRRPSARVGILQVGSSKDVYKNPEHVFAVAFVGAPSMNMLGFRATKETLECPCFSKPLPSGTGSLHGKLYVEIRCKCIE